MCQPGSYCDPPSLLVATIACGDASLSEPFGDAQDRLVEALSHSTRHMRVDIALDQRLIDSVYIRQQEVPRCSNSIFLPALARSGRTSVWKKAARLPSSSHMRVDIALDQRLIDSVYIRQQEV